MLAHGLALKQSGFQESQGSEKERQVTQVTSGEVWAEPGLWNPCPVLAAADFPRVTFRNQYAYLKAPGRRDLQDAFVTSSLLLMPSQASPCPLVLYSTLPPSAPALPRVLFSPFLPRTTKQGCPSLLLTQGARRGGSGKTTGKLLQKSSPCDVIWKKAP